MQNNVYHYDKNNLGKVRYNPHVDYANQNNAVITTPITKVENAPEKLWSSLDIMSNINRPFLGKYTLRLENADGYIGDFKQGGIGDCWMLSGLKAMACTPGGIAAIKQAITKNADGSITVNFKGVNGSYKITKEEFNKALNDVTISPDGVKEYRYSTGDADALIFELAVEKYRKDLLADKYKDANIPNYAKIVMDKQSPLDGGVSSQLFYMLTGKEACTITFNDITSPDGKNVILKNNQSQFEEFFDKYSINPKKYAVGTHVKKGEDVSVFDVTGKIIKLTPEHQYAIEGVLSNNFILSNPHDSAKKIILSKDEFMKAFSGVEYVNLKDDYDIFDAGLKQYSKQSTEANEYVNKNY